MNFEYQKNMSGTAKLLLISSMFAHFAFEMLAPIYAIFVKKIGGDILEVGSAYGLFMITSGIFIFTIGRSKFFANNLRLAAVCSYVLLTIGAFGYLFVENPAELFIVQIILGIATGVLEPSWDALYAAHLDEKEASRRWSFWAGGQRFVAGAGAFIGAAVVATFSFTALFAIMVAFNAIATVIVLNILRFKG